MSGPVLISGGTHGIGRACVERLRADGLPVAFLGRDESAGDEVATATGATFLACDMGDEGAVRDAAATVAELGGGSLGGLVNNAGTTRRAPFAETSVADWDELFAINARGSYLLTHATLPALEAGGGAVVNIASVAGAVGEEGLAIYSATKGALIALTQSLALELGDRVRFNAVCPGQIETRMMAKALADPVRVAAMHAGIPVGRLGRPEDVAAAVAWLLSADAAFVNGSVLVLDGGETAGIKQPRKPAEEGRR